MHNYHIGGEFLSLGLFGIREITFTYFVKLKQKQNLWIFLFSEILTLLSILPFRNDFAYFAYFEGFGEYHGFSGISSIRRFQKYLRLKFP